MFRRAGPGSTLSGRDRPYPPGLRNRGPFVVFFDPQQRGPVEVRGAVTAGCPSGQWERTVNPSAYAYVGSNPTPATPGAPVSDVSPGLRRSGGPGWRSLLCSGPVTTQGMVVKVARTRKSNRRDQPIWCEAETLCNLVKASARSDAQVRHAPLAQSAERFHGKEKVNGSIPLGGSLDCGVARIAGHSTPRRCSSVGRANDS